MYKGVVKWFNNLKGYGFINSKEGDLFVHFKSINMEGFKTLKEGQKVEYDLIINKKGKKEAVNISILNKDEGSVFGFDNKK